MSSLTDKISNMLPNFSSFNGVLGNKPLETKHIIMIGLAILFVAGLVYLFINHGKSVEAFHANRENVPKEDTPKKSCEILFFSADWCPHCVKAKPEWNKVKDKYDGKPINGYTVHFTEYNCTKDSAETDEMLDKYKVEGYPTIKLVKDNQVIDYDAKPTEDTLTQFLNTVL